MLYYYVKSMNFGYIPVYNIIGEQYNIMKLAVFHVVTSGHRQHAWWSPRITTSKTYFKGGSQHRNLLSHLGVIGLEGDMKERKRERERERS